MKLVASVAAYFRDEKRPRYTPQERRRLALGVIVVVTTFLNAQITDYEASTAVGYTAANVAYITSIILFTLYWIELSKYKTLRAGEAMLRRVLFDGFYDTHRDAVAKLSDSIIVDSDYMGKVDGIDIRFSVDPDAQIPTVHVRYWGEFVPSQHAQPLTEGWTD